MQKRPLSLIESPDLTPAQKVLSRQKRAARPSGMLQCPNCSSRSVMNIRNGVVVEDGKRKVQGTLIHRDSCADCWRKGLAIAMVPGGQGPKLVR